MAPLPSNTTPRLYIEYTSGGQEHVAEVRLSSGATTTEAIAAYNALVGPMKAFLFSDDAVTGARFSTAGSNLSFPLAVTPAAGTQVGTGDNDRKPHFISFTGRSSDGRRVRFTLFSRVFDLDVTGYRDVTPSTLEAALLAALDGETVSSKTISGLTPTWNPYVNYGVNSYYQRKARRSG